LKNIRKKILVEGIVQGVGFRPFIFNLAKSYRLTGSVSNTAQGVIIEAEGMESKVNSFINNITNKIPPLAVITNIDSNKIDIKKSKDFIIIKSDESGSVSTLISPDVAVCGDCVNELFDTNDRRYLYPFINCTNCGPRYTIINNIPYDRPFTSMKDFKMCNECQYEYDNPTNRRFHAQPNACPKCGPQIYLIDSNKNIIEADDIIETVRTQLLDGKIVAIKGLGGFHLAVDATNDEAVKRLRKLKGRDEKPFALMVNDISIAEKYCIINDVEKSILKSNTSPIVLVKRLIKTKIAESVAPGNDYLGIMLPYTPLHHILFYELSIPLVMTSANLSEEPICIDNEEAFDRLNGIADYFLIHNRDIYLRSDDSVGIYLNDKFRLIRRSRGKAPQPVFVKSQGPPILAVGGELKNSICLLKYNKAILSQHIGDLENLEAYNFFKKTIEHLQTIFDTKPELIVYDMHPQYFSTQWALKQNNIKTLPVQHHHAHLAACMAENQLKNPVIGLVMDGTGYGADKTIWGGEILIGNYKEFKRFAHFEKMSLPGGDTAIKSPWRTAVSYLNKTFPDGLPDLPFLKNHDTNPIIEMVNKNVNSPQTSSCGRLFDAVTAMCGGRQKIHYEAQAAIELMQAFETINVRPFSYIIDDLGDHKEILIQPIIRSLVRSIKNGESLSKISSRFHATLVKIFVDIANDARTETGINHIVLSGGVFQNMILFEHTIFTLEKANFKVYTHSQVPTNDGGISLGQAMIGRSNFN
jgi:hydrogenase maturation protein HypF